MPGLKRAAVAGTRSSLFFVRPLYADDGNLPEFLDVGVVIGPNLQVQRFRNRFDSLSRIDEAAAIHLSAATDSQIGRLGEETAAVVLESRCDATIVALGHAGLTRDGAPPRISTCSLSSTAALSPTK